MWTSKYWWPTPRWVRYLPPVENCTQKQPVCFKFVSLVFIKLSFTIYCERLTYFSPLSFRWYWSSLSPKFQYIDLTDTAFRAGVAAAGYHRQEWSALALSPGRCRVGKGGQPASRGLWHLVCDCEWRFGSIGTNTKWDCETAGIDEWKRACAADVVLLLSVIPCCGDDINDLKLSRVTGSGSYDM